MNNYWLEESKRRDQKNHSQKSSHVIEMEDSNEMHNVKDCNGRIVFSKLTMPKIKNGYTYPNTYSINNDQSKVSEKRWKHIELMSRGCCFISDVHADCGEWKKPTIDEQIEEKHNLLEEHHKKLDKITDLDLWLNEYEKLYKEFAEVYQKKHPLPGKEYTFTSQNGNKFKGKFQEAEKSNNCRSRCYPF